MREFLTGQKSNHVLSNHIFGRAHGYPPLMSGFDLFNTIYKQAVKKTFQKSGNHRCTYFILMNAEDRL